MKPLLLSLGFSVLVLGTLGSETWAQNSGESESAPQLPVGQTFKNFEYPIYQTGTLKATLSATTATGITLNRAETTDLTIVSYENGAKSTTITSPKADLYVAEQKMRTKNTVLIDRADMTASAQTCDFDLKTKKYLLRTNVKVVLKHFDVSTTTKNTPPAPNATPSNIPTSSLVRPEPAGSMLDMPGSYSADTNAAPIAPSTK
jgi:lipopolysaccharide export system protein LptC